MNEYGEWVEADGENNGEEDEDPIEEEEDLDAVEAQKKAEIELYEQ